MTGKKNLKVICLITEKTTFKNYVTKQKKFILEIKNLQNNKFVLYVLFIANQEELFSKNYPQLNISIINF